MVKAVSPVKTRRIHWAGNTSLVGAGVSSNPTRNQIFLITFDLTLDLGELYNSKIIAIAKSADILFQSKFHNSFKAKLYSEVG